jgi:hypothetical protein
MTAANQFTELIEKEKKQELINFLKTADSMLRKDFIPVLKTLSKKYNEFKRLKDGTYGYTASDTQRNLLQLASFVLFNMKDYEKSAMPVWFLNDKETTQILEWYCPDWLSDYINKQADEEYISHIFSYDFIMSLNERGFIHPSSKLIAKILPNYIFEHEIKEQKHVWVWKPENLLKRPITLQEHIWYVFEEETNLHYSGRYLQFGEDTGKEKIGWVTTFQKYTAAGQIDRLRLLKEALLASNRNFNKILSGWFVDLFKALQPTNEELLLLQPELNTVLSAPHSKPVTESLGFLKKIAGENKFDCAAVLDAAPVALSSNVKSTVAAALMLLDNLAAKHPQCRQAVCVACCHTFLHTDDSLQTRAAKLIIKYTKGKEEELLEALLPYQESLLQNAKNLLSGFLQLTAANSAPETGITAGTNKMENEPASFAPIPAVDTVDELLFFAAQAFDNNASWHIDVLPAALINLQHELKGAVLSQLQPALQRALKLTRNSLRSNEGFYDHMLAVFFIDICIHLVREYPDDARALNKVFDSFDQKEGDTVNKWMNQTVGTLYLQTWSKHENDPYYQPYLNLLIAAAKKFMAGDSTPLLSTPTHQPGWVDAVILVKRLSIYQQRQEVPDKIDMELAIARCYLKGMAEAVTIAREILTREWQHLILFLLGNEEVMPQGPFYNPSLWMTASLSKWPKQEYSAFNAFGYYEQGLAKYTGQYKWAALIEEYETDRHSWEGGNHSIQKVKETRKLLQVYRNSAGKHQEEKKALSKILLEKLGINKIQKTQKVQLEKLVYDYLTFKTRFFSFESNDIRRTLLLTPNNLEAFLAQLLIACMKYPIYTSETDKRMVMAALQVLHELWEKQGEMAHLFVATALIGADKPCAGTAAEIWLNHTGTGNINSALLGTIIGKLVSADFAPLKRFNDLAMQSLFRVSATHNAQLQIVIEHTIAELPDVPVKNLKKLLEIYSELLAINNSSIANPLIKERFHIWKANSSSMKLVETLLT